ncbi:unnamed protein product [Symbiodinium sp. CCMP2456]|nr:unnamed protein product [Symbiodinium sp. CCMP2456]
MQPLSLKPRECPWAFYLFKPEPNLETLLQLCAYTLSCRNRAVFAEIDVSGCEVNHGANASFSVVVDVDFIEFALIDRICPLLSRKPLAEEWAACQKRRYEEELKGKSWETRTHELSCLLGLRIRSLMLELPGTMLESVCGHQLNFLPSVLQAKREPEDAEDALTTWLKKVAALHDLRKAAAAPAFYFHEFSDMDGTSQVELAKCQQRCEELSEELAMAKAELCELRKESTCPAREVQAGKQSKSSLTFQPETLLDAAEFRAMLVENATYKERCEQTKLRLDRAEADLSRKTAEKERLLVESATLRERCRIVAHQPQGSREERGGAATSGAAFATMSPSGTEASSQDSDPAERMGFTVVDDCASSVLSHSSWFSVKPHGRCFVTDAIFRTRSCGIDFFLMGKDLVKGSRVVAADNETILEVAAAPEVFKETAGFDLQAGDAALRVTADHLVLVSDPQAASGIYVKAGNLKEGDLVMLDSWEPVPLNGMKAWSAEQEVLKVVFQPDLPIAVFSCPPCILSKGQKKQQTRRGGMRHMKCRRAGAEHDQAKTGRTAFPRHRALTRTEIARLHVELNTTAHTILTSLSSHARIEVHGFDAGARGSVAQCWIYRECSARGFLETRSACTAGPFNLSIFPGAAWKSLPCAEERRWPSSISCRADPMMEDCPGESVLDVSSVRLGYCSSMFSSSSRCQSCHEARGPERRSVLVCLSGMPSVLRFTFEAP